MDKDFLTIPEAAEYACVSVRKFHDIVKEQGLLAFRFYGKTLYRKADIKAVIERAWHSYANGGGRGNSTGARAGGRSVRRSAQSHAGTQSALEQTRNSTLGPDNEVLWEPGPYCDSTRGTI